MIIFGILMVLILWAQMNSNRNLYEQYRQDRERWFEEMREKVKYEKNDTLYWEQRTKEATTKKVKPEEHKNTQTMSDEERSFALGCGAFLFLMIIILILIWIYVKWEMESYNPLNPYDRAYMELRKYYYQNY